MQKKVCLNINTKDGYGFMHASTRLLKRWKIDQKTMHEKLVASYHQLAKANQFRIIPVGEAIDIAWKLPEYQYKVLSSEELAKIIYPDLPPRASDPVGRHFRTRDKKGLRLESDTIHLNEHGVYLQACVWYSFLFDEDAEQITHNPKLPAERSKLLRKCAAEAIRKHK